MPDVISKFYIHRGSDSSNLSIYQDGISGDQTSWIDPSPLAGTNWYKLYGLTMTGQIIDSGDPIPVSRGIPKGPQWATQLYFPDPQGNYFYNYAFLFISGIALDSVGNLYVCGRGNPFGGSYILYVAKYSPSGAVIWRKFYQTSLNNSICQDIAIDVLGNVLVTGWCCGTVDFDGHIKTASGNGDIFVLKIEPTAGAYIWSTVFGGSENAFLSLQGGFGIATDNSNNIWVTGEFMGDMTVAHSDFAGATGSVALTKLGQSNSFLAKFSSNGSVLWAKKFGWNNTGSTQRGYGIAVDPATGVSFITGSFQGTVDFSQGTGTPLTSTSNLISPFVAKFDASGASLASVSFPLVITTTPDTFGKKCKLDSGGNLIIGGTFKADGIILGGVTFTNKGNGTEDIFLAKLNPTTLAVSWGFSCGSNNQDDLTGLSIAPNGNIVFVGKFWNTMDVGTFHLSSVGVFDMFIASLTPAGVAASAVAYGTTGADQSTALAVNTSGVLYVGLVYAAAMSFSTTVSLPTPTPSNLTNGAILATVL